MYYLVAQKNGTRMIFPNKVVRTVDFNDPSSIWWGSEFLSNNQECLILKEDIPNVDCNITWEEEPRQIADLKWEDLLPYCEVAIEVFCYPNPKVFEK